MSKKVETATFIDPAIGEDDIQYHPNPITETVLHRMLMWAEGATMFDDAVNEAARRIHEAGNRIVAREFKHVSIGDREVVLICHLTYHVPVEADDAE